MKKHYCDRCIHHWRGMARVHNCGAGRDCRLAAWYKQCYNKRETSTETQGGAK